MAVNYRSLGTGAVQFHEDRPVSHFGNDPLFIDRVSDDEAAEYQEQVNHPAHYNRFGDVEVIDLVEHLPFNLGSAVKYITRAGYKDPSKWREDLEKAIWMIQREGERLEKLNESN